MTHSESAYGAEGELPLGIVSRLTDVLEHAYGGGCHLGRPEQPEQRPDPGGRDVADLGVIHRSRPSVALQPSPHDGVRSPRRTACPWVVPVEVVTLAVALGDA